MFPLAHIAATNIPENIKTTPPLRTIAENICWEASKELKKIHENYMTQWREHDRNYTNYNQVLTTQFNWKELHTFIDRHNELTESIIRNYNILEEVDDVGYDSDPWYAYVEFIIHRVVIDADIDRKQCVKRIILWVKGILGVIDTTVAPETEPSHDIAPLKLLVDQFIENIRATNIFYESKVSFTKCIQTQCEYADGIVKWHKIRTELTKQQTFYETVRRRLTPLYRWIPEICR